MNIPKLSIENYQFTLTVFIFFLAMGVLSFVAMPQREDPAIEIANIYVVNFFWQQSEQIAVAFDGCSNQSGKGAQWLGHWWLKKFA